LELRELEARVRRSSAAIRVKGGTLPPPTSLSMVAELQGEGPIVLTASTAGEDAQDSDQLAGPFVTHDLLSALRGAVTRNGTV
jgi:hypothetical protein